MPPFGKTFAMDFHLYADKFFICLLLIVLALSHFGGVSWAAYLLNQAFGVFLSLVLEKIYSDLSNKGVYLEP